ncbi:hypothetical protein WG66_010863 [Moniliophthora roreri]|nr:hypothetical protein WG66_010863 [Moniliophthora roreri]
MGRFYSTKNYPTCAYANGRLVKRKGLSLSRAADCRRVSWLLRPGKWISNAQEDGVVPWDDELETIRRQKELLVQWAQDPESAKLPTDAARAPAPFTGTPINPTNSITSPRTPTILGFYPVSSSSLKDSLHVIMGV